MLSRILKDLGIISVLCLGEKALERLLLPGLHRMPGRSAAADPARVDDMMTFIAEWLGQLAWLWLVILILYLIGWLANRPLKPHAPLLVTGLVLALVFGRSFLEWTTMPLPPPLR
jgi:hypothetical protein